LLFVSRYEIIWIRINCGIQVYGRNFYIEMGNKWTYGQGLPIKGEVIHPLITDHIFPMKILRNLIQVIGTQDDYKVDQSEKI